MALNRGPLVKENLEAHPLTPRQVEEHRAAGALLVDVRTPLQFDDAHVPGAVSITILQAGFGSRLAWLAQRGQDVVLLGRDDEDGAPRHRACRRRRASPLSPGSCRAG